MDFHRGIDDPTGEHQLPSRSGTDDLRQQVTRPHVHRGQTCLDEHRAEPGRLGGDADVAMQREGETAANRDAVDRGDHRDR